MTHIFIKNIYLVGIWLSLIFIMGCGASSTTPATALPTATISSTATSIPTQSITHTIQARLTNTPTPTQQPLPSPTITASPTMPTVQLIVWESLPESQTEQLTKDVEQFSQIYPNYQVELRHYDDPQTFMTNIVADPQQFDVVLASPILLSQLWATQQIAPLADFFPNQFIDKFAGVTLQGATTHQQSWGLPDTAGFHLLLYYNRDLVTEPPTTLSQLLTLADDIEKTGKYGLGLNSYDPLWVLPWLATYNGWLIDEQGQPTLNSLAMETALTTYQALHLEPGILPPTTYDAMRTEFERGNLAMMIDGEWSITELQRLNTLNWGVTTLPRLGETQGAPIGTSLVLARYWAISRQTSGERAQAVAVFLDSMTEPARQLNWTEQFGLLPTRREALDDAAIITNPYLQISVTQLLAGRGVSLNNNPNILLSAMRDPLAKLLASTLSPKDAAEAMAKNLP